MRKVLVFIFAAFLIGSAWSAPKLAVDPEGNLYQYWIQDKTLKYSKSIDQGLTFSPPLNLYLFTHEVQSCHLEVGKNSTSYIAFEISGEAYLTSSSQQLLGSNGGKTFSPPVKIAGEAVFSPGLAVDNLGKLHLIFLSEPNNRWEDKNFKLKRLNYASGTTVQSFEATLEAKVLFETYDNLINPKISLSPWGLLIFGQKEYLNRRETYLITSLDQGKHFGNPTIVGNAKITPFPDDPLALIFLGGKWISFSYASTEESALMAKEITFPTPPSPELKFPPDKFITKLSSLEIFYRLSGGEPSLSKIDISWDDNFPSEKTWGFEYLDPAGSPEAVYRLPVELPEGNYFLRLSAFDGLTTSPSSPITKFKIDRTPPLITIISPTEEVSEQGKIILKGEVSEPAQFSINQLLITLEAQPNNCWEGKFKVQLTLHPGKNLLEITATDEAGNTTRLSKTILYSSIRPEITVLKPKETDWFKPDSTIYLQAEVRDLQDDVEDETEGEVVISGETLKDKLIYDKESGGLAGFINLPKELPDGKLTAKIKLKDSAGNVGESTGKINIDRMAPVLALSAGEPCFSKSNTLIPLPLQDSGAGIDPSATMVKIASASTESFVTAETQTLMVKVKSPLLDGTYEVIVVPRDLIGNTGKVSTFSLIIDTLPPKLTLFSSCEPQTDQEKLMIKGEVEDNFFSEVKIINNQKLVECFFPQSKLFAKETPLSPGGNEIEVVALDRAGNQSRQSLKTFANLRSAGTLITSYGSGPNPFSPKSDSQMYFVYNLSSTADLKIYLFDLAGTLLWKKEIKNTTLGNTTWNGIDQFGKAVASGVYPYLIQVSSGGAIEIKRGKVIVL